MIMGIEAGQILVMWAWAALGYSWFFVDRWRPE